SPFPERFEIYAQRFGEVKLDAVVAVFGECSKRATEGLRRGERGHPLHDDEAIAHPRMIPRNQNLSRKPNCIRRGPISVPVIFPKFTLVTLRLAAPNCV